MRWNITQRANGCTFGNNIIRHNYRIRSGASVIFKNNISRNRILTDVTHSGRNDGNKVVREIIASAPHFNTPRKTAEIPQRKKAHGSTADRTILTNEPTKTDLNTPRK